MDSPNSSSPNEATGVKSQGLSSLPPQGPELRVIILVLVVACLAMAVGVGWSNHISGIFSKVASAFRGKSQQSGPTSGVQLYTCGMHPQVILPRPGLCPICHMELVPLNPAKFSPDVTISPVMSQNIGVRIAPVTVGPVERTIRTVGSVDYDETLVRDVNLKMGGWVEKLYVDYVGKPVVKDQPLLDIYSPDLYIAQEEYLRTYKNSATTRPDAAKTGPDWEGKWNNDALQAGRKRLEYLDISDTQIQELEKSGQASKTMTLRSPFDGIVTIKNVYAGQSVEPGTQLMRIADLKKVWIMASVYEFQLPYLQVGQEASVRLPYLGDHQFIGKVGYIYPTINQELRQAKVRIELDNPDMIMKPGIFANVEIHSIISPKGLLVPRQAVIDTGKRQVVFVSAGDGLFQSHNVTVGVETGDGMVEIKDGLKATDQVVISAEFLLDSESRFRESLVKMIKGDLAVEQQTTMPTASLPTALPADVQKVLLEMLSAYTKIGYQLSGDSMDGVKAQAKELQAKTELLVGLPIPGDPHFWHKNPETEDIRGRAAYIAAAFGIADARQGFADLGSAMAKLLRATGVPSSYGKSLVQMRCPMFRQMGAYWLQDDGPVRNPFFGSTMLECQDEKLPMPVAGAAKTNSGEVSK